MTDDDDCHDSTRLLKNHFFLFIYFDKQPITRDEILRIENY